MRVMTLALLLAAPSVWADTVPCTHRTVASRVLQFFDDVQRSRKTGAHGVALEGATETGREAMAENQATRRYCEAELRTEGGDRVKVFIAVTSRDAFKKDRPEDVQSCWEEARFGVPAVIGAASGCAPVKAPGRR
jgi:hypothetical protein